MSYKNSLRNVKQMKVFWFEIFPLIAEPSGEARQQSTITKQIW